MTIAPGKARARGKTATITLVLGLVAVGAGFAGWTAHPRAADTKMSVVDQLEAKEEIRAQLVLYGLLAEGDGLNPRDTNALIDKILAPDGVSQQFFYEGTPAYPERHGREEHRETTQGARDLSKVGEQHYTLGIYYDELTPTTAKTRSQHMYISVSKNIPGDDCNMTCGGQVRHVQLNNYFDDWVKTPQGWLRKKMIIRSIN